MGNILRYLKAKFTGVYEVTPSELAASIIDFSGDAVNKFFDSNRIELDNWIAENQHENLNDINEQYRQMLVIDISIYLHVIEPMPNSHLVRSKLCELYDTTMNKFNYLGPESSELGREFKNMTADSMVVLGMRLLHRILGGDGPMVVDFFLSTYLMTGVANSIIFRTKAMSKYKILRN